MRGYVIDGDGAHHQIQLLDLSYEGCGIETEAELNVGQQIQLSVLRRGGIAAEVRWVRDGRAGLVFLSAPEKATKRFSERQSERLVVTSADVTMRRLGRANFRLAVNDLSPHGCKVELVERPAVGERVLIKFEGLEVLDAEVCWIDGYTAGLQFDRPMHPAVFDLLLERLKN
jgi:hypothetical protein